jgi:predicted permease
MKRLVLKVGPLLLAFLLGVVAKTVWDNWQQIQDVLSNLFLYYQD